jgi:hypothetical protein
MKKLEEQETAMTGHIDQQAMMLQKQEELLAVTKELEEAQKAAANAVAAKAAAKALVEKSAKDADDIIKQKDEAQASLEHAEAALQVEQERVGNAEAISEAPQPVPEFSVDDAGDSITVVVTLPTLASIGDVDLNVADEAIECHAPGYSKVTISLPKCIDSDISKAKFSKKTRQIKITCPVK